MLNYLLVFELKFYSRNVSFYVMLILFLSLGLWVGTSAGISFPNITYNSPYAINFILGLFSLACLFPIVLLTSQSLLREKDTHFEQILYTTGISNTNYLLSRFLFVFGMTILTFIAFLLGYMIGHVTAMDTTENWGVFRLNYYFNSFLIIVLPNIFLCTTIICSTAWLSKNKMLVYLSGLFIYVLYMVGSIFSNSPLLAGASPVSDRLMSISAKLDPFGMAAFYEQTRYWTAIEKNTVVLGLSGNMLFNRAIIIILGSVLLFIVYKRFQFKISTKQKKKILVTNKPVDVECVYTKIPTKPHGKEYFVSTMLSFLRIDLKSTIKGIPFVLLLVITLFILGMEMYGAITGGIRLPEYFVTTPLMANTMLSVMPSLLLLAMLFYGSELTWRSKECDFLSIEDTTPYSILALFTSKFIVLLLISLILIFVGIVLAIFFQVLFDYLIIDWYVYLSLFYYIGVPASLSGIVIIAFHYIIKNKYIAMAISAVFLVLTNTALGEALGLTHPLFRFANYLPAALSDIAGFGYFLDVFVITILYSLSFAIILFIIAFLLWRPLNLKSKGYYIGILILPLSAMLFTGIYISKNGYVVTMEDELIWKQHYEEQYKSFKNKPQPSVTNLMTSIDLFPETNSYKIKGTYYLMNKNPDPISEVLISTSNEITYRFMGSSELELIQKDKKFGQYLFRIKEGMASGDSIALSFSFEYRIEPLKGHQPFNAIVDNGAFMRISNYFPVIGYNTDNEIEDKVERNKRGMPLKDAFVKFDAPLENPYNYEFIDLDATISTSIDQTAVSVGELVRNYTKNNRNYFHYKAFDIPFRFAISSAKYAVHNASYNAVAIEVLYDPKHHQNISHLMNCIKATLEYCEKNYGIYPYKTIRFAEISSFTRGFAATAYPATIFINERYYHLNHNQDGGHDIINELIAHELSHQWWGNAQLKPDYREGSGVLTETLAQYTQLMLYKQEYGEEKMLEMVRLHQSMYDSEKAFSSEEPLYKVKPTNINVIYNKGLVKMYDLYVLIGEMNINLALKNLLENHKFPSQPATTMDLMEELKKVTKPGNHESLENIFMK